MRVSELMRAEPQVVNLDTTLAEAGAQMVRLQIRHLPVVDTDGALCGMVTDYAIFKHGGFVDGDHAWMSYEPETDDWTCANVKMPVEVTATLDEEIEPVLRRLTGTRADAIVVVNDSGHPVGILTEHDVLGFALDVIDPNLTVDHEGSGNVRTIDRDSPGSEALEAMNTHRIRHMVVTEENVVVGVLSYGDAVADDVTRRPELTAMDVVRSLQVRTRSPGTSLHEVAALMKQDQIGCVPIVDGLGVARHIVTRRDVLEAAIAGSETNALF